MPRSLVFRSLVIPKRSEKSHKSLLPQSLRFLTSLPMTSFRLSVILNEVKNPEDSGLKKFFWILHFVQNDYVNLCHLHLNKVFALLGGSE